MTTSEVEPFVRRKFAEFSELAEDEIFVDGVSMSTVIARSDRMTNSLDIMEAFARTSKALRAEYGVRVRLPTMSLDTPMSTMLKAIVEEFEKQKEAST